MDVLSNLLFLAVGYFLGSRESRTQVKELVTKKVEELRLPKPGVVNHLTDEQKAEKNDPIKKGNLESFNRFFKNFPIKK